VREKNIYIYIYILIKISKLTLEVQKEYLTYLHVVNVRGIMKYLLHLTYALELPGTFGGVGFVWVSWAVGSGRMRMSATAAVWDGGCQG
jgi:hypothetical protein